MITFREKGRKDAPSSVFSLSLSLERERERETEEEEIWRSGDLRAKK